MPPPQNRKPKPGEQVLLIEAQPRLLQDLPVEDRRVINEAVGTPVRLIAYDGEGRAELEFIDSDVGFHFIYVDPGCIKLHKSES